MESAPWESGRIGSNVGFVPVYRLDFTFRRSSGLDVVPCEYDMQLSASTPVKLRLRWGNPFLSLLSGSSLFS